MKPFKLVLIQVSLKWYWYVLPVGESDFSQAIGSGENKTLGKALRKARKKFPEHLIAYTYMDRRAAV